MDPALRARVRFRFGAPCPRASSSLFGDFPPQILFKIFTAGAVVDIGNFAPRNYALERVGGREWEDVHVHKNIFRKTHPSIVQSRCINHVGEPPKSIVQSRGRSFDRTITWANPRNFSKDDSGPAILPNRGCSGYPQHRVLLCSATSFHLEIGVDGYTFLPSLDCTKTLGLGPFSRQGRTLLLVSVIHLHVDVQLRRTYVGGNKLHFSFL